jgi:GMP synthase (glutamine-hydrolysing)
MRNETVLVLDFGGQYKQLIARRVRELGVYSEIIPGNTEISKILAKNPAGIILTGGPSSVYEENSPKCSPELFSLGIPVLGICYGIHLMSHLLGGKVESCGVSEYGQTEAKTDPSSPLFSGLGEAQTVLMSHTDLICALPEGFRAIASTRDCPCAAFENPEKKLYGTQFHPEVVHTVNGVKMLKNFLYNICGAKGGYTMDDYIETEIAAIREKVGSERVLLALSGGVDSSVCAALLSRAIPDRLVCIFVDHGFMRKNEADEIEKTFSNRKLEFVRVDASERFLSKLAGVTDPETKRKIIGREFIEVFQEQALKYGDVKFLAQGTIYPDVIESGVNSATIKSHHNVGGLPESMNFIGIVEPLRSLFKDEVRAVGRMLRLPSAIVDRQPFPGPGLAIRIIGEVTREKLDILREADAIVREEFKRSRIKASQFFAVLTNLRSVGVMGDGRTYDYTIAVRAVVTGDFMTCEYARVPHSVLSRISTRITNEVKGINRVVYDITGKPPATIEWE